MRNVVNLIRGASDDDEESRRSVVGFAKGLPKGSNLGDGDGGGDGDGDGDGGGSGGGGDGGADLNKSSVAMQIGKIIIDCRRMVALMGSWMSRAYTSSPPGKHGGSPSLPSPPPPRPTPTSTLTPTPTSRIHLFDLPLAHPDLPQGKLYKDSRLGRGGLLAVGGGSTVAQKHVDGTHTDISVNNTGSWSVQEMRVEGGEELTGV
ncbi:hypothetical protein V1478_009670 [Vespula squamosa]|uniref:Uncharacterized protein n=1 Tax=Vespula squamosa TaxID=30214 RepID=A0ABD2AQA2_VESSQ